MILRVAYELIFCVEFVFKNYCDTEYYRPLVYSIQWMKCEILFTNEMRNIIHHYMTEKKSK